MSDISSGTDPYYDDQWHLNNTGQTSGTSGEDLKIGTLHSAAQNLGQGVRVVVVDDGLEINHEDLTDNVNTTLSYNVVTGTNDPTSNTGANPDAHGTPVAGIIAARGFNGKGVRGVAPCATLAGINLLQNSNAANEVLALTREAENVWISNNSWGPADNTGEYALSTSDWRNAIMTGLTNGRSGRGIIYLWAAGNGANGDDIATGVELDNSNYDGYANFFGVVAVCALDHKGKRVRYSERGANLWVCGFAEGNDLHDADPGITTTDPNGTASGINTGGLGDYLDGNYTQRMNGTSAATPTVSGVVALILKQNPNLTWRDVKYILAKTARQVDSADSSTIGGLSIGWQTLGSFKFHHKYGFGAVDATAAVALAATHTNLGPLLSYETALDTSGGTIPEGLDINTTRLLDTINVSGSGIGKIEFIEVEVTINHNSAGDLIIMLRSGTRYAVLSERHPCYDSSISSVVTCSYFTGGATWRYGVTTFLDQPADGNWDLILMDENTYPGFTPNGIGTPAAQRTLTSWRLKFYGRAS